MPDVPSKGPELKRLPDQEFMKKVDALKYDPKNMQEKAYAILQNSAEFPLISKEITGHSDSDIVFTREQLGQYIKNLGGDSFLEKLFHQGKNGVTKEYLNRKRKFSALAKKFKKAETSKEPYDTINDIDSVDASIVADLAARLGERPLSNYSYDEFYGDVLDPSLDKVTREGLSWWENHNKVGREAALKRREAQAAEDLSEGKDLENFYKEIFKQNFAVGQYELSADTAVPKLEKKEYKTIGRVDNQWHKERTKVEAWYRVKSENAKKMLSVFDQIEHNFTSLKDKAVLRQYQALLTQMSVMTSFKAKDWKKLVDSSGLAKSQIYGPEGVYNLLLAFQRASVTIPKGNTDAKVTYRLMLGKGVRSTRLLEKISKDTQNPSGVEEGPRIETKTQVQELPKEARVDKLEVPPVPKMPEKVEEKVDNPVVSIIEREAFLASSELADALDAQGLAMVRQTTGYIKAGEAEINCQYSISYKEGGLPFPLTSKENGIFLYKLIEATADKPSRFTKIGEVPFVKGKVTADDFAKKIKEMLSNSR